MLKNLSMKPNLKTFAVGVSVFALSALLGSRNNIAGLSSNTDSADIHSVAILQSPHHKGPFRVIRNTKASNEALYSFFVPKSNPAK